MKYRFIAYHIFITLGVLSFVVLGQLIWFDLFSYFIKSEPFLQPNSPNQIILYAITANGMTLSALLSLWVYQQHKHNPQTHLTLRNHFALMPVRSRQTVVFTALFLALLGVGNWVTQRWQLPPNDTILTLIETLPMWQIGLVFVIIAPICEEWVFRGFLWNIVKNIFIFITCHHRRTTAIILTNSLCFTLIHLQYQAIELAFVFVLSLILCFTRYRCRSLLMPIFLHILNNGIALMDFIYAVH